MTNFTRTSVGMFTLQQQMWLWEEWKEARQKNDSNANHLKIKSVLSFIATMHSMAAWVVSPEKHGPFEMWETMFSLQWPPCRWMMNGKKSGGRRGKHGTRYTGAFRFSSTWNIKAYWSTHSGPQTWKGRKIQSDEFGLFAAKINKSKPAAAVFICSHALSQKCTRSNNICTH